MCVFVNICVCEREREEDRERCVVKNHYCCKESLIRSANV